MEPEFIIWGWQAGKSDPLDQAPLYTQAKSMPEAERVMAILAEKHGCHGMTVQILDGALPDFAGAVR
jgi:hypothetical protein